MTSMEKSDRLKPLRLSRHKIWEDTRDIGKMSATAKNNPVHMRLFL
jgi:hypothetical protein